ncbi:flavin reductase [Streptomyces dioscori]|uniref:Flavin reductase n=1 Tax=Streptomyces dioscori TaxID=2109333 RepID=A0A2P8Q9J6_9ACTN|nr:flavin reductase family protein [Streptomyces dioscori]PSM42909.1 flavin reductase [Streptomyces dioscori]
MSEPGTPTTTDISPRDVLGHFASGVTVITADGPRGPVGFTCQSFASLSLDPLLVSFAPARTSGTWPLVRNAGAFAVNVLAADQSEVSAAFARRGTDRFRDVTWSRDLAGAPLLAGTCAWISCTVWDEYDGGDHTLVVGRVTAFGADEAAEPLVFHRGRYRRMAAGRHLSHRSVPPGGLRSGEAHVNPRQ